MIRYKLTVSKLEYPDEWKVEVTQYREGCGSLMVVYVHHDIYQALDDACQRIQRIELGLGED